MRLLPLLLLAATALAQTPPPQLLRRVPPPGIAIASADRAELTAGVAALGQEITALEKDLAGQPERLALLPDVLIFHKAIDWALRYDEFFSPGQVAQAKAQLEMGNARAAELRTGKPSWNAISGADGKPAAEAAAPGTSGSRRTGEPDGKDQLPALVVRGYRSKIDGSVQPYGVVLPEDYKPGETKTRPLHFWCHGRGEKLSELDFINQRLTSRGEFTPPGAFVLHLYGRYCCANKFAGEVDLFEALEDAKKHYPIDDARLVVRGFSMGGASTWQFGTHFAGMWAAANPGAGFGESKEFLKLGLTPDKPLPPEWEQKLWRWYDSTLWVSNLANTTTVAYSGEIDGQKQAADIMIRHARQEAANATPHSGRVGVPPAGSGVPPERTSQPADNSAIASGARPQVREGGTPSPAGGTPTPPGIASGDGSPKAEEARVAGTAPDLALYHVIGPQTPHKILAEAKPEVEKLVEAAVARRNTTTSPPTPPLSGALAPPRAGSAAIPKKVRLTTYSLVYSQIAWLRIVEMEKHWERADVAAEIVPTGVSVKASNVASLLVELPYSTFPDDAEPKVKIEGAEFPLRKVSVVDTTGKDEETIRKLTAYPDWKVWQGDLQKTGTGWREARRERGITSKQPGICGPIDHAFMDSFVFVRPSGKPLNKVVGDWVESELGHAVTQWRQVFRGDARVVADTAVSADDIAHSNLILWGDPSSNAVLKKFLAAGMATADRPPAASGSQASRLTGQAGVSPAEADQRRQDARVPGQAGRPTSALQWDGKQLVFAGKTYDAAHLAPILIFPNPLNPQRYVVLNSGFTFREAAALNNAQQTPKLPDWAIVDLRTPPDAHYPGKIVRAGFFDEQWQPPAQ